MDEIKKQTIKGFLCLFTGIIIGIISGIVGLTILISYRMDEYQQRISYLQTVIEEKEVRLNKLEESVNKQKFILKNVEILFVDNEEEDYKESYMDRPALEKHIKEKYNSLIGKEIKTIDVDMVTEIVDKRIMKLDGKEYQLIVNKVVLSDILKLWIEFESSL